MKLSNKLVTGALGVVIFVLLISTSITLFFIYNQNMKQADNLLNQSVKIMKDDMDLTAKRLLISSHQISISNEMGSKVNFMREQKDEEADFDAVMNTAREMVKSIYNNAITGNLWKVAIYDQKGDLTAYVRKEADQSYFGFPFLKSGITAGKLKTGEELSLTNDDYWGKSETASGFQISLKGMTSSKTEIHFERGDQFLVMVVYYPILHQVFDFESGQDKIVQVGLVMAVHRFDAGFTVRLSDLTRTGINVFHREGLSVGVTEGFDSLDLNRFQAVDGEWNIQSQSAILNLMALNGQQFKQALVPVYNSGQVIGAFSSIYSTDTALENTWLIFKVLCLILIGCIIIIIPITFFFSRSMTRPLVTLFTTLSEIEHSGEFEKRVEIKSRDEIGKTGTAFNALMESLQFAITNVNRVLESVANSDLSDRITDDLKGDLEKMKSRTNDSVEMLGQTIRQVKLTSDQVKTGSQELSSSAQSLADGTSQQAASLEEISSSMNEIEKKTRDNNESANQAQRAAAQALEAVRVGNDQMQDMVQSMDEINATSTDISKIIKVIDEIAFQTNLLALNAAVEAARAGKYGKGFAVVAEEVRNLASRSADAARNTTELIEKSSREINKGVDNANKTAEALTEIDTSVKDVHVIVKDISVASDEQSSGIVEINKGLVQVNDIVQRNSSISEQTASASDELFSFSTQMENLIAGFKLIEESGSATATATKTEVLDEGGFDGNVQRLLT